MSTFDSLPQNIQAAVERAPGSEITRAFVRTYAKVALPDGVTAEKAKEIINTQGRIARRQAAPPVRRGYITVSVEAEVNAAGTCYFRELRRYEGGIEVPARVFADAEEWTDVEDWVRDSLYDMNYVVLNVEYDDYDENHSEVSDLRSDTEDLYNEWLDGQRTGEEDE